MLCIVCNVKLSRYEIIDKVKMCYLCLDELEDDMIMANFTDNFKNYDRKGLERLYDKIS